MWPRKKIAPGARARPTSAPTLARASDCLPEPPEGGSRRLCLPHTAAARRAPKTREGPRNHAGGPSASRPRGKQTQRQSSMRKETVTAAGEPGHAAARTPPGATAAVASGHIARLLRIVVSAL